MTDLEHARQLLAADHHTCVLVRGDLVITSSQPGISPMLDFIDNGQDLAGASAADRIIGKAAAMLFTLAGVTALYGEVVSQAAVDFCKAHDIPLSYGTLAPHIINRQGTGVCPMEATVATIDDLPTAFTALKAKRDALRAAHP